MTQENRKNQERINYKNFALAMLAMVGIIMFIIIIGSIGFLDGLDDNSTLLKEHSEHMHSNSYSKGRFIGDLFRKYIGLGLLVGNLFALVASLEKHKSLPKAILNGLLGWFYIIYYALTSKTKLTN